MNFEPQKDSPEELEANLTALLLGELPPQQAEALRQTIRQDENLRLLYERIKLTIDLVRETSASPAGQTQAQPASPKLSSARREKLLEQLKTVAPKEFKPRERLRAWLVPAAMAAGFVALLAVGIGLLGGIRPHAGRVSFTGESIVRLQEKELASKTRALDGQTASPPQSTLGATTAGHGQSATPEGSYSPFGNNDSAKAPPPPPAPAASPEAPSGANRNLRVNTTISPVPGIPTQEVAVGGSGSTAPIAFSPPQSSGRIELPQITASAPSPLLTATDSEKKKVPLILNLPAAAFKGTPKDFSYFQNREPAQEAPKVAQEERLQAVPLAVAEPANAPPTANTGSLAAGTLIANGANFFRYAGNAAAGTHSPTLVPPGANPAPELATVPGGGGTGGGFAGREPAQRSQSDNETDRRKLSAGVPVEPQPLYSSDIKVDPMVLSEATAGIINWNAGSIAENSTGGSGGGGRIGGVLSVPRIKVAGDVVRGGSATTNTPEGIQAGASNFFSNLGVDLSAPNSLTYNQREGTLRISAPKTDLDTIERAAQALNFAPAGGKPGAQASKNSSFQGVQPLIDGNGTTSAPNNAAGEPTPSQKPHATNAPIPQPEVETADNAFSTFSLKVSDVSFKLAAASLEKGVMPDAAGVRSEEFINAFDYRDPEPAPGVPVAFAWERSAYPFAQNRDLLRFSLKTAAQGRQADRPLNIVLLLDNSGSMERADRVQIIREALRVLAAQLQPQDKLSIVTFARTAQLRVDGVSGSQAAEATAQVSDLTPQGGTNLEEAMNLAYLTALRHYLANGVNRVVLLTDGAANLGDVEPESLQRKVETHRKQGIALDCFGIGWEGYNDDLLEILSRHGDGRYGFINSPEEAATGFAAQLAGALQVAASDVKVQVEFNPARVAAYRQIGYAKHQLTKEQFRDNTVNAAQIAAAESGNALYVIAVDPAGRGPLGTVRVRYRLPGTSDYREHSWEVPFTGNAAPLEQASPALRLAATAGAFSEWLGSSPFAGEVDPPHLLGYLRGVPEVYGADGRPRKLEWMIRQAQSVLGGKQP